MLANKTKITAPLTALLMTLFITLMPLSAMAENYRVRLYFGLSLPDGGGVSLKQWQRFEHTVLAKALDGFNVVDSTGYYLGEPERSKIVTVISDEKGMEKIRQVARQYATRFNQDSVMMVKIKVDEWAFIGQADKASN